MNPQIFQCPWSILAYLFLALSVLSLWFTSRRWITAALTFFAVLLGTFTDRINFVGIFYSSLLFALAWAYFRSSRLKGYFRPVTWILILLYSLGFCLHIMPGYDGYAIISRFKVSADSRPFRLILNFDKPLMSLILVSFGIRISKSLREWKTILGETFSILLLAFPTILGIVVFFGYARYDFKWFSFSPLWLLSNLAFTCIGEEALFRGLIQNKLTDLFCNVKYGTLIAWFLASLLFGILRFGNNWNYRILSSTAGLFYGLAYMRSSRIESSILVHFFVNAIHFIAFSYPSLK